MFIIKLSVQVLKHTFVGMLAMSAHCSPLASALLERTRTISELAWWAGFMVWSIKAFKLDPKSDICVFNPQNKMMLVQFVQFQFSLLFICIIFRTFFKRRCMPNHFMICRVLISFFLRYHFRLPKVEKCLIFSINIHILAKNHETIHLKTDWKNIKLLSANNTDLFLISAQPHVSLTVGRW